MCSLESKVTTLQEQLTQLALELLHEPHTGMEQRLRILETLVPSLLQGAPSSSVPLSACEACSTAVPAGSAPSPQPAELRSRSRIIPLIEYGAQGSYVVVCPHEGALSLTPDSPAWFDWLASLTSFRFVGQSGRFSACREASTHVRGSPTVLSVVVATSTTLA